MQVFFVEIGQHISLNSMIGENNGIISCNCNRQVRFTEEIDPLGCRWNKEIFFDFSLNLAKHKECCGSGNIPVKCKVSRSNYVRFRHLLLS